MVCSNSCIIITVDYELFGDGSGCVRKCVLEPMDRMLKLAEKHGARLTIFVEALEFMALGKDPARRADLEKVRAQLGDALSRGHGLELHLHPQWAISQQPGAGKPVVDMSRWRLGDLDFDDILALTQSGKRWIEEIAREHAPGYVCKAFRAGAWCVQPSGYVAKALTKCGIRVESSVAPGVYNPALGDWYDFRAVPTLPYWRFDTDVCVPTEHGITELPIAVANVGRFAHARVVARKVLSRDSGLPDGCSGSYNGPNTALDTHKARLSKIRNIGTTMLDFCSLPGELLVKGVQRWTRQHADVAKSVPVVMIGHTKTFARHSENGFQYFLQWAAESGASFSTMGNWSEATPSERVDG